MIGDCLGCAHLRSLLDSTMNLDQLATPESQGLSDAEAADHAALLADLLSAIEKGTLVLQGPGGKPLRATAGDRQMVEQLRTVFLPKALASCAELGLLIS